MSLAKARGVDAEDVARHLVEQHDQGQRGERLGFPIAELAGHRVVVVGGEIRAHRGVELWRAAEPDLLVVEALGVIGRPEPEIEQRLCADRQGRRIGGEWHAT